MGNFNVAAYARNALFDHSVANCKTATVIHTHT
jgi:hypothetical protein